MSINIALRRTYDCKSDENTPCGFFIPVDVSYLEATNTIERILLDLTRLSFFTNLLALKFIQDRKQFVAKIIALFE